MDSVVRDLGVNDLLAAAGKVAQVEPRVLRGPELMVLACLSVSRPNHVSG